LNRRGISRTTAGAAVILVGLLVGGGAFYVGQAFADPNGHSGHVTGTAVTTIQYYIKTPTVVGPTEAINTHADSGVFTGGMTGTDSLLLQAEFAGSFTGTGVITASFTGPFAGTVGDSNPGSATAIGTTTVADVSGSGGSTIWYLHGTFSLVNGVDGLAGICGSATFTGTSTVGGVAAPVTGAPGTVFTFTYEGAFTFGGQCNSGQGTSN
jgi:hypothetical protein